MGSYLKQNRSMILVIVGTLLFGTSMFWEYVRMEPAFRFIVDPWSLRGYETAQGWVFAAAAAVVLIIAALLTTGVIKEKLFHSLGVVGGVTIGIVAVPILTDARDMVSGWPITWGLGLLAALAAATLLRRFLPASLDTRLRRLGSLLTFLVVFIFGGIGFHNAFGGEARPVWVVLLIAMAAIDVLVLVRTPAELAPYRALINLTVIAWLMSLATAATVRVTLQTEQFEMMGLSTDLAAIQVTSGMVIAWLGGLITFAGVIALWAGRREHLAAEQRARSQIEAARVSAEELGETELQVAVELEEVIGGEL